MPQPFTYLQTLTYMVGLGERHRLFAGAATGYDPAGNGTYAYPLLFVEDSPLREQTTGNRLPVYSFAWHVLARDGEATRAALTALGIGFTGTPTPAELKALCEALTDQLVQQLRDEQQVSVDGTPVISFREDDGTDLATGCYVELRLQVASGVNRQTNADYFDAATPLPLLLRPLADYSPADIFTDYPQHEALAALFGNSGPVVEAPAAPTNPFSDNAARRFAFTRNPLYTSAAHEYRVGGGAWTTPVVNPIPVDNAAHPAGYVQVRVRSLGGVPAGLVLASGAFLAGPAFEPFFIHDEDARWVYSGPNQWFEDFAPRYLGGREHYTQAVGATATLVDVPRGGASAVRVWASRAPNAGSFQVYLNGGLVGTYSQTAASIEDASAVAEISLTGITGTFTLQVVAQSAINFDGVQFV